MTKKKKSRRWIIIVLIVVAVLAVALYIQLSQTASSAYDEVTATTGTLETYYSFSGNVAVKNSQVVAAKGNHTIRDIYVEVDQRVAAGDALLRLSNGDVMRSDIAGEITDVHVSVGDSVSAGTQLVKIADFDNLQVLVKVDEFDVLAVHTGKEAVVTIDALGLSYVSTVEHISKQAQSVGDVNYYEAKLLAPADDRVLPGMKVDARILNSRVENAVLLSMNALQFDDYNRPYVYVRGSNNREITRLDVSVGLQDGITVEITGGLRAGDVVLVPQSRFIPMLANMR